MCGVCGTYGFASGTAASAEALRRMTDVIHHRGPDEGGAYLAGPVGLGVRRLSIIDLAGGSQPIANEDGTVVVVFNGEIYNYDELAAELRARGHQLATACDTEVIVHLYEEYGVDCVDHLRGMFGFALWDSRRNRLVLVRDRLGIKPLYFAVRDGSVYFGSEIKAILAHGAVQAEADLDALGAFLSLKYVPAPQTMFTGIEALPPGHRLVCEPSGPRVERYWDLDFAPAAPERSEAEYAEELEAILRESVRIHLMSDVPFGAFLSGGVDSSTVVALMSQILGRPVDTFCVAFEGEAAGYSEARYARMVADRYETNHHEALVRAEDFIDLSQKIVWHLDQPVGDEAALANFMVAELAARHVKMVLTGEGGDELFGGYARHAGEKLARFMTPIPGFARRAAVAGGARLPRLRRAKIALQALMEPDETMRLVRWFPLFTPEAKQAVLVPELRAQLGPDAPRAAFARELARVDPRADRLSRMLYVDTKLWLPDDLLARGDKMSMAASLEARVPLLDHRLVEFAARVPSSLKVHGWQRKYLLKQVASQWLPREIIDRPKKGFPMPIAVWFRGAARPFVRDILAPDAIRRRGLFAPDAVERLLTEHESGSADRASAIWALMNIELWYQCYIDGAGALGSRPSSFGATSPWVGRDDGSSADRGSSSGGDAVVRGRR